MNSEASIVRSGVLVTGTSLSVRLLNLVSIAILARILVPADFGAVALGIVLVSSTQLLSTVGMGSALIASKLEPRAVAFHAFLINLGLGAVLFALAFGFADQLAALLGDSDLGDLFRFMSVIVLVNVLGVVPDALLIKEMQFGRRAVTQLAEMLAQMVVSISLAVADLGAFALAAGLVASSVVGVTSRALISPKLGWLRLQTWQPDVARSLFRFGGTAMATGIVRHLYSYSDNVLIGRLFGTRALGFYSQAYNITNLTVQNISQVVNTVLLPVYAKVGSDPERTAAGFHRAFRLVGAITVPAAVGMFVLAPEAVLVLLGPQWETSVVFLQILAVMTLFRPLAGTTHPLFLGVNRPELSLRVAVAQALFLAPLVVVLLPLGVAGVALAVGLTFAGGAAYSIRLATRRAGVPIRVSRLLRDLVPIGAASVLMGATVHSVRLLIGPRLLATPAGVVAMVLVGVGSYVAYLWLLDRHFARSLFVLARGVLDPLVERLDRGRLRSARRALRRRLVEATWLATRLRHGRVGRRRRAGPDAQWRPGLPPGFPDSEMPNEVMGPAARCEHEHLSGWKAGGAWRIRWEARPGCIGTVVFKDADYDVDDVPAIEDLPLRPGPAEWYVYRDAGSSDLQPWLPTVFWAHRDDDGSRYQYLIEDLAPTHRGWSSPTELLVLAARLPALHEQLTATFGAECEDAIRLDAPNSLGLVGYLETGLVDADEDRPSPEGRWVREHWGEILESYRAGAVRAYHHAPLVGIHGDCNLANVLFPRSGDGVPKLLDWEWAGLGLPHADLASVCKAMPRPIERAVVLTYHEQGVAGPFEDTWDTYLWCKLQRGLLDAAFLRRQLRHAGHVSTSLSLPARVDAALRRARQAHDELAGAPTGRS